MEVITGNKAGIRCRVTVTRQERRDAREQHRRVDGSHFHEVRTTAAKIVVRDRVLNVHRHRYAVTGSVVQIDAAPASARRRVTRDGRTFDAAGVERHSVSHCENTAAPVGGVFMDKAVPNRLIISADEEVDASTIVVGRVAVDRAVLDQRVPKRHVNSAAIAISARPIGNVPVHPAIQQRAFVDIDPGSVVIEDPAASDTEPVNRRAADYKTPIRSIPVHHTALRTVLTFQRDGVRHKHSVGQNIDPISNSHRPVRPAGGPNSRPQRALRLLRRAPVSAVAPVRRDPNCALTGEVVPAGQIDAAYKVRWVTAGIGGVRRRLRPGRRAVGR